MTKLPPTPELPRRGEATFARGADRFIEKRELTLAEIAMLQRYRDLLIGLDEQVRALKVGEVRFLRGKHDATDEAIERAEEQRTAICEVLEHYDPHGVTA